MWKDIKDFEGYYQVSDSGEVKSLERFIVYPKGGLKYIPEKIMTPVKLKNGYLAITLCKEGIKNIFLIHRLVAETFLINDCGFTIVNHINENKEDNSVNNLEWCTQSHNAKHSSYKYSKKVKIGDIVYNSIIDASRQLRMADKTIRKYANLGNCYKGLTFKYI